MRPFLSLSCAFAAFAVFALTLGPVARAEESGLTPAQMVANLQSLQARIAQGDTAAYAAQSPALHDIAGSFSAAGPEVWKIRRNVEAAVAYLLGGGQPRVIARLIETGALSKEDEALMRGALAYVLGREREAESLLGPIDPKILSLELGGQLAFAQSMLAASKDKKKAVALLDLARLLSPGGLVEEAALRREIFLAGDMRDAGRFAMLSRQYVNRFSRSVYADNFLRSFAATVARLGLAEDLASFQKFDNLTASLAPDSRRELFLTIARAALLNGKIEVAEAASRKALLLGPGGSGDEARGRLYEAAARIVTEEYDPGLAELKGIDATKLNRRDVVLLAAAREVATLLHEAPQAAAPPPAGPLAKADAQDAAAATIRLAETSIAGAGTLLSEKAR